jgi:hypothetical protein
MVMCPIRRLQDLSVLHDRTRTHRAIRRACASPSLESINTADNERPSCTCLQPEKPSMLASIQTTFGVKDNITQMQVNYNK